MDLFDLHCDTLYECFNSKMQLKSNNLAVSLEKGRCFKHWSQVFAVFTPDSLRGQAAVDHYNKMVTLFKEQVALNSDKMSQCVSKLDIQKATSSGRMAAILSIEGGCVLNGSSEMINRIINDGVKLFTLTWNGDNELASGVFGSNGGLTEFGIYAIEQLQKNDIIIDVSHLNEKGFWQVMDITKKPVIASHSNFSAIHSHPRNLSDEQFEAICKTGGVVGFNFYENFLGKNCFEKLYGNIIHALELGGENHIAFGSDFDGCTIEKCLDSIDKTSNLCDYLLQRGISKPILDKLCYLNSLNLF